MYYSNFSMLALLITLIINHSVLKARKTPNKTSTKIRYKRFLLVVILYYVTDILWGFLYEQQLTALVYADTVLYFAAMVLSVLLWTIYVVDYLDKKSVFSTILTCAGWLILLYELVSLLINFFIPILFSFDADNVYRPGSARHFTLGAQITLFLAVSIYTLVMALRTRGKTRSQYRTIGFSGIVMAAFIILQTFFPLVPFYAVGCLIATCLVHTFITEDEKKDRDLDLVTAKQKAYTDPLTGVKSAYAYAEAKEKLDKRIASGALTEFGVVVFDLNGLKSINDTEGHDAGDRYLESASHLIGRQFKHSPLYRIGGDEFVVFLEKDDYRDRAALLAEFDRQIEKNLADGVSVIVSSGLAEYRPGTDDCYHAIFERADRKMYERKRVLKERS
ncbi:MAG: diguanylate cyclase [Eubacteriales bacterium]|nr:diguanylate cyclase [Eubacteriales bacterium]